MSFSPLPRPSFSGTVVANSVRFRWVACQFDTLLECLSPAEVRETLEKLPRTLDDTYAQILQRLRPEYKGHAIRLLQLLTYSERPLRLEEAVDAVAVEVNNECQFDPLNRMPVPEEIARYCSSLVSVVTRSDESMEIHLAHFSVQEYLRSSRLESDLAQQFEKTSAAVSIVDLCLSYLSTVDGTLSLREILQTYPFAQFSARYWTDHAFIVEKSTGKVLDSIKKYYLTRDALVVGYRIGQSVYSEWDPDYNMTSPLYLASQHGLRASVTMLLDSGADVNQRCGGYGNALQGACAMGHEEIVHMLIDNGADVNIQGGEYDNALYTAAYYGRYAIAQVLIAAGANVNAQGGILYNALQAASFQGYTSIVTLLIEHGADVNALGGYWGTALQAAAYRGHETIFMILLEHGADIYAPDGGHYSNVLNAACGGGHTVIVQTLLDRGFNVNVQAGEYVNALYAASYAGHDGTVQLLLSRGADVNRGGGHYFTALQAAAVGNHQRTARLLLDAGADVNAQGGFYGTALQAASLTVGGTLVQMLIDAGANVNTRAGIHVTALQAASSVRDNDAVMRILIKNGADTDVLLWKWTDEGDVIPLAEDDAVAGRATAFDPALLEQCKNMNIGRRAWREMQYHLQGGYQDDTVVAKIAEEEASIEKEGGEWAIVESDGSE